MILFDKLIVFKEITAAEANSMKTFSIDYCMRNNEARFLEHHDFGRSSRDTIVIPTSMQDLYVEDEWVNRFATIHDIPYTADNIEHLMQIYIQAVYFEHWYTAEADAFTIPSVFYPLSETEADADVKWTEPKFVRLNSVSPKYKEPVYSLREARRIIRTSPRCLDSIHNANQYGFPNLIVIRDWKDLSQGNEYRTFIYNDKLTGITNHDGHIQQSFADAGDTDELIQRVQTLLNAAKYCLPHTTICMDVFIHNTDQTQDCVIEFSSYGAATDTGSGGFHWLADMWDLAEANNVTVRLD